MKKLKLRKPTRIIMATVKGQNSSSPTVFIKDYTGDVYKP